MTANLRRVKCRRKRSRRNEIAFRTTGEQTLEKNRKMEWAVILLIFCGLAAMVLMVARVNLPVAMGLMVVLNWAVTIRFKNYQRRLEGLAFIDPVTGGNNLNRFLLDAGKAIEEMPENYMMVSMDVQDFKMINDVYGRAEGDRTLAYIYRTLKGRLRSGELLARGNADVFYMLLRRQDEEDAVWRLKGMRSEINNFNKDRQDPYYLELRFGAYIPEPGEKDVAGMEEKANIARKSQSGKSTDRCVFYDWSYGQMVVREKELVDGLEKGLANREFEVYLQPKVNLERLQVDGAEALIRWNHPQKGMLSPAVFVPVFEKYRRISRLDSFVFTEVCRILRRWSREGRELCRISVNISRQNFDDPNFIQACASVCRYEEVECRWIELELTESIFLDNPERARDIIDQIHDAGFTCSLDDFGTGYSSLGLLNALNVDVIKLDRSFFIGKNDNQRGRNIVETILRLAEQLHINTVAEGIDNTAQAEYLRQSVCDTIQGYVFYEPMPVDEFEKKIYEEGRLGDVKLAGERVSEEERVDSVQTAVSPSKEIMTFLYFPEEDRVIFSALFSPAQKGSYSINHAKEWFKNSDFLHQEDRETFLHMLSAEGINAAWMENTLRVFVDKDRYEWLELYISREQGSSGGDGVVTGVLSNMGEWRAELDKWREKADRDELTGLYNRAFFERWVTRKLESADLERGSLIFIDVDNFKEINDRYGHLAGDEILRFIAQKILGVFRRTDVVARYGGDEYVIFVSSVSREILTTRLNQLCGMFQEPYRGDSLTIYMSASIGASYYPDDGQDFRMLLEKADQALYEAKRRGKNQYVIYED